MLRVVCIGAQKAGTTWLYMQLRQHPQLSLGPTKEVHFWDLYYKRGIDWYRKLYDDPDTLQGDFTPAYAILPNKKIAVCHRYFPELRLIYIAREPIARTWSSIMMFMRRIGIRPEEASDQFYIDFFRAQSTLLRSSYAICRENWLKHYSSEQLLILHFDDIALKPHKFLKRCCAHMGISDNTLPREDTLKKKIHAGPIVPIRRSLLPVLEDIYSNSWKEFQPFIERV